MTTRRQFVQTLGSAAALGALYPMTGFAQTLDQVKIMYGFPPGSAGDSVEGEFSARARHVEAITLAIGHAERAEAELVHEHLELAAEELRLAHEALGEITGRMSADDLLGRIFSSFCIGK